MILRVHLLVTALDIYQTNNRCRWLFPPPPFHQSTRTKGKWQVVLTDTIGGEETLHHVGRAVKTKGANAASHGRLANVVGREHLTRLKQPRQFLGRCNFNFFSR